MKAFKRQQKELIKKEKQKRLDEINILLSKNPDSELIKEKEQLEFDLMEKSLKKRVKWLSITRLKTNDDELYQHLIGLLNCRNLNEFAIFLDNNCLT